MTWEIEMPPDLYNSLEFMLENWPLDNESLHALGANVATGPQLLVEWKTVYNGFHVKIYSNEHPPPHFHVIYNGEENSYRIDDCEPLNDGLKRHLSTIRLWHMVNKESLIKAWNSSRPSDCPVGIIQT